MTREGVVYGMSEDEYHGQGAFGEFKTAEFSSSAAKEILKSAAHYDWVYNRGNSKTSKAMDIGTAVHTKVLGVGAAAIAWPDELLTDSGKRSTGKEARAWEEEQAAKGLTVFSKEQLSDIDRMVENLLAHPDVGPALEQPGSPEVSMFATCPDTGVRMRGRFDFLPTSTPFALDVKTGRDASLKGFVRAIDDHFYDVQHGHYIELAEFAGIDWIEEMLFVVVENVAPFNVNTIRLDRDWIEMGLVRARAARRRLVECQRTGVWPGYPLGVKVASPPPWTVTKYQDEMSEEMDGML